MATCITLYTGYLYLQLDILRIPGAPSDLDKDNQGDLIKLTLQFLSIESPWDAKYSSTFPIGCVINGL